MLPYHLKPWAREAWAADMQQLMFGADHEPNPLDPQPLPEPAGGMGRALREQSHNAERRRLLADYPVSVTLDEALAIAMRNAF